MNRNGAGGRPGTVRSGSVLAIALTRSGVRTAARLAESMPDVRALVPDRFRAEGAAAEGFDEPVAGLIARHWPDAGGFVLVMAAGIAVRSVAPLLRGKAVDPAVLVMDPLGRYVVPILSGHLGGANDLAREIAARLGAEPVLTTATDAMDRPAIEVWARDHDLKMGDPSGVVAVNGAWANGEPVALYHEDELGADHLAMDLEEHLVWHGTDARRACETPGTLIALSHRREPEVPAALVLRPRCLVLGVGCRRDAEPEALRKEILHRLGERGFAVDSVCRLSSVEAKREEPALQELARFLGVPFRVYPASRLETIDVPGPSARVARAVGTASVAEAAALASGGARLVCPKEKGGNWTFAVALVPLSTPSE